MVGVMSFPRTTIGKKVIMALSGAVWVGFLAIHMYGNLKVFNGPEYFNAYAEGLRDIGSPIFGHTHLLWVGRIVFVVSIASHIWAALTLNQRNRASRPAHYADHKKLKANSAQLTMIYGGVALGLFIVFHLMHFTLGWLVHPDFQAHDAYHNVIVGFQSYSYIPAFIYLLALVALGFHLFHGTWSMFQTLGFNNKTYTDMLRGLAWLVAIVISVGFAIVPISVMLGILS